MTSRLTPTRLVGWAAVIGVVAGAVTMAAVVALTIRYRPVAPGMSNPQEGWLVLHRSAAAILGMACFAAFLVLVWPTGGPVPWRRPGAVVATAAATVVSALAILTHDMVLWEQISLHTAPVGGHVWGYWFAAFGSEIRYVLVDGAEVSQTAYAITLLVHIVTPVLAATLLAVTPLLARGDRTAR